MKVNDLCNRQGVPGPLSKLQKCFSEQGYAILPKVLTKDEVQALEDETLAICRGERGLFAGLEQVALGETRDDVLSRVVCIHYPHKVSRMIADIMADSRVVTALTSVIGPNVKAMQSMLFVKASGKPGQAWHQDEQFIPTRDRSLAAVWIALDDATVDNGCLWVLPGSHREGVLYPLRAQDDERFDCSDEAFRFPYPDEDAVPVELPAGSAVLFDGHLLHRSLPNRRPSGYRRALVHHYMSAESLLPWTLSEQVDMRDAALADFRDIVLVAGRDPYAWKGVEDLARPHVRRLREGGCKPVTA